FIAPSAGEIELNGRPVHGPGPDRIMVFQEFDQLLPWKTVRDNVIFPLRRAGLAPRAAGARADDYIARVGLSAFAGL
ncbi:ABC transporter ATP-binding protein, partial [Salmonella enterica]